MKELVVVAIGGNSIIKDNNSQSIEAQEKAVQEVARHVSEMLEGNYNIVLTHGNGPQVGLDLRRAEIAHTVEGLPLTPLTNCVADTQGGIGYLVQQALTNILTKSHRQAITVITQVEVDKNDPNFRAPTKPIGAFLTQKQAEEFKRTHPDWHFIEDSGRGYRRVVASPEPKHVVESSAIRTLTEHDFIVVAAGGGGIPVTSNGQGGYQSIDAVIDKDLSTTLLAKELQADILIITTGVEKVCVNFGKPDQKALGETSTTDMQRYMEEGHFPAGSMLPKIEASLSFIASGGKRVIITTPEKLTQALRGETGTHIVQG